MGSESRPRLHRFGREGGGQTALLVSSQYKQNSGGATLSFRWTVLSASSKDGRASKLYPPVGYSVGMLCTANGYRSEVICRSGCFETSASDFVITPPPSPPPTVISSHSYPCSIRRSTYRDTVSIIDCSVGLDHHLDHHLDRHLDHHRLAVASCCG